MLAKTKSEFISTTSHIATKKCRGRTSVPHAKKCNQKNVWWINFRIVGEEMSYETNVNDEMSLNEMVEGEVSTNYFSLYYFYCMLINNN